MYCQGYELCEMMAPAMGTYRDGATDHTHPWRTRSLSVMQVRGYRGEHSHNEQPRIEEIHQERLRKAVRAACVQENDEEEEGVAQ